MKFEFDDECLKAFTYLKDRLILVCIIVSANWYAPVDIMCDTNGLALGVVLGQRREKILHPIYYTIKFLNPA